MAKYYSKIKNKMDYPFFAYGIFKPGQIAFSRIEKYVKNYFPEKIDYKLSIRDGVPFISKTTENHKTKGYLIYFKNKEAYKIINNTEPDHLYGWGTIKINGRPVNVLFGENIEKGNPKVLHDGFYDGLMDPFFSDVISIIKNRKIDYSSEVEEFYSIQMYYLLLWASIERYAFLRYGNEYTKPNIKKLSKEKIFEESLKRHLSDERTIFSTLDFEKHTLSTADYVDSMLYYYQIRCNSTHRGKSAHSDAGLIEKSLNELLNIFEDILNETFL